MNHWHISIDNILLYGVSALIVFNVIRLVASLMVAKGGALETPGKVLGSLVHFGS